jgi:endonuclease/exonuclease/phosphatase family metal-dependent hydrolase
VNHSSKTAPARCILLLWLLHAAVAGAQVFRVATFNIENYLEAPTEARPAKSATAKAAVCKSIVALKPDVIALEEVGASNALPELQGSLKKAGLDLPNWEMVEGSDPDIHVAVLSRFPIVARRPHTNEVFLLAGRRMRVCRGFVDVDIQVSPRFKFTLIAAHLKSRRPSEMADEEEWRYEEAVALRRVIDARLKEDAGRNLVVLGDFNDIKDSKPVRVVMGRGRSRLFDTRPAERDGAMEKGRDARDIAWTHFYAKEDDYSRIDYILLSHGMEREWLAGETYVLRSPDWGEASDHRPLVAGFVADDR